MCIIIPKVQKSFPLADDQKNTPYILEDLNLLLTILKAVGLFPYFTKTSAYEIEPPSRQKCFYSTFIRVLSHTCTIVILYHTFRKHSFHLFTADRDTDNINQYIEMFFNITTYTGTSILCAKHSKLFFRILSDSLKLDADIQQRYGVHVQNQCESIKLNTFLVILCQIFIIGIKINTSLGVFYQHYFILGFYALQSVMCSVIVLLISSIFRMISMRFEFVNMILNNYSYKRGEIMLQEPNIIVFREEVSTAFHLHNRLLKIYKMLNESTSLLVALLLGYAFYSITTNTYNIFVEFTTKRNVSVAFLLNCFAWLAFNSALLVTIISRCGETTKKANTTSQILARVYGKSKNYQNIIDKFLTKSIRQEVQFTAYGFFVVDNSTLFKIFSAVTTYLVILIQFKQLEDTKLDESVDKKL